MCSSTMIPPVEPSLIPACAARRLLGSFFAPITTMSTGISPSEVLTAWTRSVPRNALICVFKWMCTPISRQDSSTGAMMSGSAISAMAHGCGSTRCVSMPRCARAVAISTPIGWASAMTARFTVSRISSQRSAARMSRT